MTPGAGAANWTKAQSRPAASEPIMVRTPPPELAFMPSPSRTRAALAAALCAAALPAGAVNEMFAKDAPITRMTDEDFRIASETMRKAFDSCARIEVAGSRPRPAGARCGSTRRWTARPDLVAAQRTLLQARARSSGEPRRGVAEGGADPRAASCARPLPKSGGCATAWHC